VPQPAVATNNRFSLLGDEVDDLESLAGTVVHPLASPLHDNGAAEPVGPTATSVDQIPSGAALPAPRGESVVAASDSSATASPSEPSLQLHLSMSEQPAESVVSLANPSPVGGTVELSADTSVSHTPVCTTPSVPSFLPESDDAASYTAEFSPPPVHSRQVLVASGSAASPAAGSAYSFALAVSSDSSLPLLRQGDSVFPELPDIFSPQSAASEGPLTTPSHFPVSPVFSSGDSFYARSFFSDEEDPLSLPAASEQSDSLADQSLVRPFTNNNNNNV
jgi:hypothetical protein